MSENGKIYFEKAIVEDTWRVQKKDATCYFVKIPFQLSFEKDIQWATAKNNIDRGVIESKVKEAMRPVVEGWLKRKWAHQNEEVLISIFDAKFKDNTVAEVVFTVYH